MRFADLGDRVLHYALEGAETGPPLVLIHSLGYDLRSWDGVVPTLAARYAVLRYDLRGHGLSEAPPGLYTMRDHTADLELLLQELDLPKAVVCGISIGGMVAMDFAAQHPGAAAALILLDTGARIGTAEVWEERIEAVRTRGMEALAPSLLERQVSQDFRTREPALYRGCLQMLARTPVAGYVGSCAALRDADLNARLEAIRCPTLVLHGSEDVVTPVDQGRALAERLADGRFDTIEGAGHLLCVERPEALSHAILSFLRELTHV